MIAIRELLQECLQTAAEAQAKYYNKSHMAKTYNNKDGSFQLNPEVGHSSNFRKQIPYAEALSVVATRMHAASDSCKHKMNALHEFQVDKAIPNYEYR